MKKIILSIDVEPDLHTQNYESIKALPDFVKLLDKYNIKASFFITCDCIKKHPKIFQKIKQQGHEVELHGYGHKRIDTLPYLKKQEQIKESIKCFKKYLNSSPVGFRAVQHGINSSTIDILKENHFKYDSSIMPWNIYHLLFFWKIYIKPSHNFASMKPHFRKSLLEIPISSFVLPFSSVTLRFLPKSLLKVYFSLISSYKAPVFLMHSWDLIEISGSKLYKKCPKHKFLEKFEYMLNYFSKQRKFVTLTELADPIKT